MFLLPYRKLELQSPLSARDATEALASKVEPRRWFRSGPAERAFEGKVDGASFDVRRIIGYRNSFLPQIRGTIRADAAGSIISITMTLHLFVLVFLAFWVTGLGTVGVALLASAWHQRVLAGFQLMPLGMLLFAWLLTIGSFAFEARKAQKLLLEVFAASQRA